MTPEDTRLNLSLYNIDFDCSASVQKFRWIRREKNGPITISLWVACQHPIVEHLADSFVPHMDACVCWYHDHDGLSCMKVLHGMTLLQKTHSNVWLMMTVVPKKSQKHESRIRKYYCENGFPIKRLDSTLEENIEEILRVHLMSNKTL